MDCSQLQQHQLRQEDVVLFGHCCPHLLQQLLRVQHLHAFSGSDQFARRTLKQRTVVAVDFGNNDQPLFSICNDGEGSDTASMHCGVSIFDSFFDVLRVMVTAFDDDQV